MDERRHVRLARSAGYASAAVKGRLLASGQGATACYRDLEGMHPNVL
ncbi:MAG: hypothetical protein ACYDEA_01295 [Candidatus Dormibacteria bacterium]